MKSKLGLVLLALASVSNQACTEDAFAGRLRRSGNFRSSPNKSAEPLNALDDQYTDWLFWFASKDLADPWTPDLGTDSDISLDDTGEDSATTGVSTSGVTTVGGIGTKNLDQAVTFNGNECYRDAATSAVDAFGPDLHVRTLFKFNGAGNDFLFSYRLDNNNALRFSTNSISQIRVITGNDVTYNCDSSGTLSTGNWYFVDFTYDADGGATSKGKADIYVNGTHTSCSETSVAGSEFGGGGNFAIGDDFDCGNKNMNGDFIGVGFRESLTGIDETEHDADCAALGLC